MKKLILIGLAIVISTSCQQTEPRYFSSSPEIDTVKALLNDYYDGNWDSWKTHYADTAKIYSNTWKTAFSVQENQEALFKTISSVSSYKFDEEPIFFEMTINDEGQKWVNFWGNWRGIIKDSDVELEIPVHLTMHFVDGKIVEEYGFWNKSPFVTALIEVEASKMEETQEAEEGEIVEL